MTTALILGAKSSIAQAIASQLATAHGYDLVLAARQCDQLRPFALDLQLHSQCRVSLLEYDALDFAAAARLPARARDCAGDFQLVVLVYGYLGVQRQAQEDTGELLRIMNTNFVGAAVALEHLAGFLVASQEPGGIIAIGSVAGDRGRQSNYAYGAAKGGLALYLQGLRNRLASAGVHVLTVKPGFVDTPMTQGLPGLFLVASPERVARDMLRAYWRRRDVLYTPWFWRYIMWLIRLIPERVFKRMRL